MGVYIKGMEMPEHCGYCRFRYDGICHALQKTQYSIEECPLVEVPDRGMKTNGDIIREMTDKELADWFGSSEAFCPTGYYQTNECDACTENCIKHWLSWLKQEAKE